MSSVFSSTGSITESISQSSASASDSATQVATTTISTTFSPSSTWRNPFPSQSDIGGGGGGGGGGQQQGNDGNSNSLNSSASLYLYTFLATLVLLLGVSAAIVFRSLILRRRHRAMIEEAIRNGTWVPPTFGRGKVDLAMKPVMYEVCGVSEKGGGRVADWDGVKPFSVSYTLPEAQRSLVSQPIDVTPVHRVPWHRRVWGIVTSTESSPVPSSPTTFTQPSDTPVPDASAGPMHVSVLIAMPNRHPHTTHEEEELPHVEVGVAEVVVARCTEDEDAKNAGGSSNIV